MSNCSGRAGARLRKLKLAGPFFLLLTAAGAATVSGTSAVLGTGEEIAFQVSSAGFGYNAGMFGLSKYPSSVSFAFVMARSSSSGSFWAALGSPDGAVSVDFAGPLTFRDGLLNGAEVSTLEGYLRLSPSSSKEIFETGYGVLTLQNGGPEVTMQWPPFVSLGSSGLSVGATVQREIGSQTPEPESNTLVLAGGALLCAVSGGLATLSRHSK